MIHLGGVSLLSLIYLRLHLIAGTVEHEMTWLTTVVAKSLLLKVSVSSSACSSNYAIAGLVACLSTDGTNLHAGSSRTAVVGIMSSSSTQGTHSDSPCSWIFPLGVLHYIADDLCQVFDLVLKVVHGKVVFWRSWFLRSCLKIMTKWLDLFCTCFVQ